MEHTIGALAQGRRELKELVAESKRLEQQIAASDAGQEHAQTMERIAETKRHISCLENSCREGALEVFRINGETSIHPALKVKQYTVLNYSPELAKAWCMRKFADGLRLDKRAFEKAAKVLRPKFVAVETEPRLTIARDLSGYLEDDRGG